MEEYYGIIDNIYVENPRVLTEEIKEGSPEFIEMKNDYVRFIHYPDCQQLVFRLPNNGWDYGIFKLQIHPQKSIVEEVPVMGKLNGNYQIVYDTLFIAPGMYTLEINWKMGFQHKISFIKNEVAQIPLTKEPGKKEPVMKAKVDWFNRRIEYDGNLRAGTITFAEKDIRIKFSHEIGGGNCMFFVFIPTEQQWEKQTDTPLSDRNSILQFVATTLQREQASSTRFEIEDSQISFYFR
ncbi:MAG: hypothetical protein ABIN89_23965 [Chitinophagaceae bacterium]